MVVPDVTTVVDMMVREVDLAVMSGDGMIDDVRIITETTREMVLHRQKK